MKPTKACPGCASLSLSGSFKLARQPVVLNYRFKQLENASKVARRDVELVQCNECGLVFNVAFDISAIPYDQNYENTQSFSTAFTNHLRTLAGEWVTNHGLCGGRVLEVGCGKGDFLRLLCEYGIARGEGYDTSFESGASPELGRLLFHSSYVRAADITAPFDAIVCRHVVEHVPEIGVFLRELHAIARAAADPVVLIETPRFEWIVEQISFWDVFYEHCNYFSMGALAYLCRSVGFSVIKQSPVFGSQYQTLELRVSKGEAPPHPPGVPAKARLEEFAANAKRRLSEITRKIARKSKGRAWALWGAGAKGVSLANQLREVKPLFAIDSNPAKQGCTMPGTSIPIIPPNDIRLDGLELVLIMNPNYLNEISAVLKKQGFTGSILTL